MSKKPIKKLADLAKEALDMSKEARIARAKEMGFDPAKTWFHGTSGDFNAFDNRYLGGKTTGPTKRLGFHFAADPSVASDYANISDTSQLAESRMKADAIIESFAGADPEKKKKLAEALKKQNAITAKLEEKVPPPGEGAKVIPAHLKMKNPLVYDTEGGVLDNYAARIAEMAREDGHDGIVFKNTYDTLWNPDDPASAKPTEIAIVFDPSQIRSVNAKFDPKKKGSGNILDSLGPIAVGAAGVGVASQDAEAKPLDMSKVARMKRAEELGFDTAKTYFHGTKGNISEFKVNPDRNGLGVYFSETPETANSYAMGTQFNSTGANVIPANLRQEKVFDIADKFKHEIVNPENKDKFLALFPKSARGPIEAKLREGVLPFGSNVAPAYYLMEQVPEVKKALTDGGYTSLRFNDWLNNKAEPVTVAFNPADIRSTNAAFDPKKKNSAKILAGGAGAATLAASNDALAADLNSPVASGMGEVVSQAGHAMERFDAYTSNPFRKFLNSALEGKGIIQSAREGVAAIGAEKPTTGEEVAKNFLSLSPNQNLGFPTADGGKDYPLAGPLGVAVDFAVDPTNIPMAKAVGPSMDAASSISRIIEQSLLKRGLVLP